LTIAVEPYLQALVGYAQCLRTRRARQRAVVEAAAISQPVALRIESQARHQQRRRIRLPQAQLGRHRHPHRILDHRFADAPLGELQRRVLFHHHRQQQPRAQARQFRVGRLQIRLVAQRPVHAQRRRLRSLPPCDHLRADRMVPRGARSGVQSAPRSQQLPA